MLLGIVLFSLSIFLLPEAALKKMGISEIVNVFIFILPIFLFITAVIHIIERIRITNKLNKAEIDFENMTLTIKNIDPLGKHFYENITCSIGEIRQFRLRSNNFGFSIFKRYMQNTVYMELKNGDTHTMFPISRIQNFNSRRYIDLLTSILRI